jgi:hypothetical protein
MANPSTATLQILCSMSEQCILGPNSAENIAKNHHLEPEAKYTGAQFDLATATPDSAHLFQTFSGRICHGDSGIHGTAWLLSE